MSVYISAALRERVRDRADGRCEYCLTPDAFLIESPECDHVRPLRQGGRTVFGNLAFACRPCNHAKGVSVATFDQADDALVRLFDPRADLWAEHFRFEAGTLFGLSPVGRGTVRFLKMNVLDARLARVQAVAAGFSFPRVP